MDYLIGEKEALIYSREQLEMAHGFLEKFSKGLVVLFSLVAVIFAYITLSKDSSILFLCLLQQ